MKLSKLRALHEICAMCPFRQAQINCPVEWIRGLGMAEQTKVLSSMPEVQIDAIIEYHAECVLVRTSLAL